MFQITRIVALALGMIGAVVVLGIPEKIGKLPFSVIGICTWLLLSFGIYTITPNSLVRFYASGFIKRPLELIGDLLVLALIYGPILLAVRSDTYWISATGQVIAWSMLAYVLISANHARKIAYQIRDGTEHGYFDEWQAIRQDVTDGSKLYGEGQLYLRPFLTGVILLAGVLFLDWRVFPLLLREFFLRVQWLVRNDAIPFFLYLSSSDKLNHRRMLILMTATKGQRSFVSLLRPRDLITPRAFVRSLRTIDETNWHGVVGKIFNVCALIIIDCDPSSEGVTYELEQIIQRNLGWKTVIIDSANARETLKSLGDDSLEVASFNTVDLLVRCLVAKDGFPVPTQESPVRESIAWIMSNDLSHLYSRIAPRPPKIL